MALGSVPDVKLCAHCGCLFRRNMKRAIGDWTRQRYCSTACGREARRPPEIACAECGVFFRPTHGPKRGGKYCSPPCAGAARRVAQPKARYRQVKIQGRHMLEHRAIVEKRLGRRLRRDEIVHHDDRDKLNNADGNLILTDAVSHGLEHHPPRLLTTWICEVCDAVFTPHKTKRGGRKKTCSAACWAVLRRRPRAGAATGPVRVG